MKKLIICLIYISGIVIPLACGNQNNAPSAPINGTSATSTHTSTNTPTPGGPTSTPTSTATSNGTPPTAVPTFSTPTPSYNNNYVITAHPNGLYVDVPNAVLYVAESQPGVSMLETFNIGNGTLSGGPYGNLVINGYPTPEPPAGTPTVAPWSGGTTITLQGPQSYENPNGYNGTTAILDVASNGAATLYTGNNAMWNSTAYGQNLVPVLTNGYQSGDIFNSPKGMVMDSGASTIYVADTGNARIDAFSALGVPTFQQAALHEWTSLAPGTPFIKPTGIALDSNNTVWVSDPGYTPSVIEAYTSGGATVLSMPLTTISGCIATGLAVTVSGGVTHVYVADGGNNQIEVYNINATGGTILTACSIPVTYLESANFNPYSVALSPSGGVSTNIIVGDIGNNNKLEVFQVRSP